MPYLKAEGNLLIDFYSILDKINIELDWLLIRFGWPLYTRIFIVLKNREKNKEFELKLLTWLSYIIFGRSSGGVYFWKISGGCLIFEFYCIFMH